MARSPLEPFTEEEARGFLRGKGIASEAVMEQIWRLSSGGLPLLVAMMAENAPTGPDAVVDPCELAVERFLKWETDEEKRQLAQSGAMPRVLDADIVAVLGGWAVMLKINPSPEAICHRQDWVSKDSWL